MAYQSFTYGGDTTFVVPAGVTQLDCLLYGSGGFRYDPPRQQAGGCGQGGMIHALLTVTPGETLTITCGAPGFNGAFGGGGGMTDIRQGGSDTDHIVIVAGGGGAAPGDSTFDDWGGNGGYPDGQDAKYGGAGGGTQTAGGRIQRQVPQGLIAKSPGSKFQGGEGYNQNGGGGGYYGGGGGSVAGAGGGGSSWFNPAVAVLTGSSTGGNFGKGYVILNWGGPQFYFGNIGEILPSATDVVTNQPNPSRRFPTEVLNPATDSVTAIARPIRRYISEIFDPADVEVEIAVARYGVTLTSESVPSTYDTISRFITQIRSTAEIVPVTSMSATFVTHVQSYVRNTYESVPSANDSTTFPTIMSTFISKEPLPIYVNVFDSQFNPVGVISELLTRPIFRCAINGGCSAIELDLPSSAVALQNGYMVKLYEQGGDGSVIYQGVIENLPDTYSVEVAHKVSVSPMIVFLGATDYTMQWTGVDVAVIVRDIVAQCPYLHVTPTSVPNVQGGGNLLSAENASFEGGTLGTWLTGTNMTLLNIGFAASTLTGIIGGPQSLLSAMQLGTISNPVNRTAGVDGSRACQITITNAVTPVLMSNLRVAGTPAAAGNMYTGLASLRAATKSCVWTPTLVFLDLTGVTLATASGAPITDIVGGFTQAWVSAVAPVNTANVTLVLVPTGAAVGDVHILDAASIAANGSLIWTPGFAPGSAGLATLSFSHVSALQAMNNCVQAAGPTYYFFVDDLGVVWLAHHDPVAPPTYQLARGADYSVRDFSAPIDNMCNFVEVMGGNKLWQAATVLSTPIANTRDVLTPSLAIFNVQFWSYPPDMFVVLIDSEQILVRGYGDVEIAGPGDMSVRIYQRGYGGTTVAAHAINAAVTVFGMTPATTGITAFYDGSNGAPVRALIPPASFPTCYDYQTLQHLANTMGGWLNRKVTDIQITLPSFGKKISLSHAVGQTVSYWEPSMNPMVESYRGSGVSSPNYLIASIEIDGGVQTIHVTDMPFSASDLQYFLDNMLTNALVVQSSAQGPQWVYNQPPSGVTL